MADRSTPTVDTLIAGIRAGDRALLARAITLVESNRDEHRRDAQRVIEAVLPLTGGAVRVGITGVPGVGKSTFIERFGMDRVAAGQRVAVLAIDPSSSVRGGSILGDKTRMARLASTPNAYIRPSPSRGSLGGVHRKTRETLLLCEAAGFDVVLVETVGVGQSETAVSEMVDTFLVLMLPGAGDELQGIKKGILEVADLIVVNKADGDAKVRAEEARRAYHGALRYLSGRGDGGYPPVLTCSALTGEGVDAVWEAVRDHHAQARESGALDARRATQRAGWLWALIQEGVAHTLRTHPALRARLAELEPAVRAGTIPATAAADEILAALGLALGALAELGRVPLSGASGLVRISATLERGGSRVQLGALNRDAMSDLFAEGDFPPVWSTMTELEAAGDAAIARLRACRERLAASRSPFWQALHALDRRVDTEQSELMDRPDYPAERKLGLVKGLHRLNRALFSYQRFLHILRPFIEHIARRERRPARLLELASGSGEFTLALASLGAAAQLPVEVTGSDVVPGYIRDAQARALARDVPAQFRVLNAFDLREVTFGDYDLVFIAQSIHHFSPGQVAMMVAQAHRAGARRFVGVDGRRGPLLWASLPPLAAMVTLDRDFVHDAVISARRFYSEPELETIARVAAPRAEITVRAAHPGLSVLTIAF